MKNKSRVKNVTCIADMGSIRIYNKSMACFFDNGFGDGLFIVKIENKNGPNKHNDKWRFEGHFEVAKGAKVYLANYDCKSKNPVATFRAGRYPVYSNCGNMYIGKWE